MLISEIRDFELQDRDFLSAILPKQILLLKRYLLVFGNFLDLLTEAVENSARDFRDVEVDYEKILCNREALAFQRIPKFPQKFQKNKNAPENNDK